MQEGSEFGLALSWFEELFVKAEDSQFVTSLVGL
jgi:hypothetical protein